MSDCFILLCAGKSKRFKSKINKQFITYKNKPLFEHSLKIAQDSKFFKRIFTIDFFKINYLLFLGSRIIFLKLCPPIT